MSQLCEITISGPELDLNETGQVAEAVAAAVAAGWEAPRIVSTDDDFEAGTVDDEDEDGSILDYRVLGYPGGAIIYVVLEGADTEQAALAAAGLARHLTTWSPTLLEYSIEKVSDVWARSARGGELPAPGGG